MNNLGQWFESETGSLLLTALAHSLWLGGVITLVVALALKAIPNRRANLRYVVALSGQMGLVSLTMAIFAWGLDAPDTASPPVTTIQEISKDSSIESKPQNSVVSREAINTSDLTFNNNAPTALQKRGKSAWINTFIGYVWLAGFVCILMIRLRDQFKGRSLTLKAHSITEGPWFDAFQQEYTRLKLHVQVEIKIAESILSPAVFGVLRPVLLIPKNYLSNTDLSVIEAIIAHELAHVKRMDPLVQIIQYTVEAILFFNPFVWLLSRWIHLEREAACDEVGAEKIGRVDYGELLLNLAANSQSVVAPAGMALADKKTSLGARVRRILSPQSKSGKRIRMRVGVALFVVATIGVLISQVIISAGARSLSRSELISEISKLFEDRFEAPLSWDVGDQMIFEGRVVDTDGKPVADAEIIYQIKYQNRFKREKIVAQGTDANGYFRNPIKLRKEDSPRPVAHIIGHVYKEGFVPARIGRLSAKKDTVHSEVQIERSQLHELLIVNESGEPIEGVEINYNFRSAVLNLANDSTITTNAEGKAFMYGSENHPHFLSLKVEGYVDEKIWRFEIADISETSVITLYRGESLQGIVLDRETGEPIGGAEIYVIYQIGEDGYNREIHDYTRDSKNLIATSGPDGRFEAKNFRPKTLYWLLASADGYLSGFPGNYDTRGIFEIDETFAVTTRPDKPAIFPLMKAQEISVDIELPKNNGERLKPLYITHDFLIQTRNPTRKTSSIRVDNGSYNEDSARFRFFPQVALPLSFQYGDKPALKLDGTSWTYEETLRADFSNYDARPVPQREVRVILKGLPENLSTQGSINLSWTDQTRKHRRRELPIIDGVASKRIPLGPRGRITVRPGELNGYSFPETSLSIDYPYSDQPIEIVIDELIPAGVLRLHVDDQINKENLYISIASAPKFFGKKKPFRESHGSLGRNETYYLLSGVPLDQKLRITVRNEDLVWSEFVTIDSKQPLLDKTLKTPDTVALKGTLINPDGTPCANEEIRRTFSENSDGYDSRGSYSLGPIRTQPNGEFLLEKMNPQADGEYILLIKGEPGIQPIHHRIENFDRPLELRRKLGRDLHLKIVDKHGAPMHGLFVSGRRKPSLMDDPSRSISVSAETDMDGLVTLHGLPTSGEIILSASYKTSFSQNPARRTVNLGTVNIEDTGKEPVTFVFELK